MVTYKTLEISKGQSESGSNITLNKIENMKKVIKSHRAALDFDKDFIMKSITATNFNFEQEVEKGDTVRNEGSRNKNVDKVISFCIHFPPCRGFYPLFRPRIFVFERERTSQNRRREAPRDHQQPPDF